MGILLRALVGLTAVTLAACSRPEPPPPSAQPRPPARATVAAAAMLDVEDTVDAVGTVRSRAQSVLSSKIVATVLAVHAREGDHVRAGQLLVELDDRDVAAQLRRARAGLVEARAAVDEAARAIEAAERAREAAQAQDELARTTLDRSRRLVERELIARQDHDEAGARARVAAAEAARAAEVHASLLARRQQAIARIEQAEAEIVSAETLAGHARVVAPAAGIVTARTVEVGNLAAPGTPLMTLDDERYRLEAALQESDLPRVRLGQPATVNIESVGRDVVGPVVEIVPAADAASRTFVVKIDLPPLGNVRSGVYGRARFAVGARRALLVPRGAVTTRGQLEGVLVVDGANVARLRLVKTGRPVGERVEVLSGLDAGERVVAAPSGIADGQEVQPAS